MSEIEVEILTEEDLKQELKELIQSKIVGLRLTPNSGVGLLQIKAACRDAIQEVESKYGIVFELINVNPTLVIDSN